MPAISEMLVAMETPRGNVLYLEGGGICTLAGAWCGHAARERVLPRFSNPVRVLLVARPCVRGKEGLAGATVLVGLQNCQTPKMVRAMGRRSLLAVLCHPPRCRQRQGS